MFPSSLLPTDLFRLNIRTHSQKGTSVDSKATELVGGTWGIHVKSSHIYHVSFSSVSQHTLNKNAIRISQRMNEKLMPWKAGLCVREYLLYKTKVYECDLISLLNVSSSLVCIITVYTSMLTISKAFALAFEYLCLSYPTCKVFTLSIFMTFYDMGGSVNKGDEKALKKFIIRLINLFY